MNLNESKIVKNLYEAEGLVFCSDLVNKAERTLLFGRNRKQENHHVYIKEGKIYVVVYQTGDTPRKVSVLTNNYYVPDEFAFIEDADFEFCVLMARNNIDIPFTSYSNERDAQLKQKTSKYSGETL